MNKFLPVLLTMTLLIGFFIFSSTFMTSRPQEAALSIAEVSIQMEQDTMRTLNVHTTLNINDLAWVSSDTALLTVHQGRLTALNAGLVTVWVFHDETALSDSVTIEIIEVPLSSQALNDPHPLKTIEPLELEIEIPSDLEPKVTVETEPELTPEPEPKVDVITPPTIYTITITHETGVVITTLEVEEGALITPSSLELPELFKGFYLEGETCTDEPFDLETPITEDLTLIQASYNDEAPCLQLDYIVLSGRPVAGSTLTVDIFPIGANVTISWYTSVNNRTYREIQGESSSTFTVRPEDSGKFIRVYVVSDSNPPVVRYDTAKLDVFKTVNSTSAEIQTLLDQGFIPISSAEDFFAIQSTNPHSFAGVLLTEGGLSKSYALVNDINLSSYTQLTQSFISGTFTGTFDGKGYTISNFNLNTSITSSGLFLEITNATLKNFTIDQFTVTTSAQRSALLVASARGNNTLTNIIITNSRLTSNCTCSEALIGALIAFAFGNTHTLTHITQGATITANQGFIGGFVGVVGNEGNVVIESSTNEGNVTAGENAAGAFVGKNSKPHNYRINIVSSQNTGIITEFNNYPEPNTTTKVVGQGPYILVP